MTTQVDLQQLAIDRGQQPAARCKRRRPVVSRYVLPGAVLLGFLAMLGWAARDRFLPSRPVTVVPVIVARAEVRQAGTPLFRAAGWVEPRPTPVLVTALTEGVVEELHVVAGQTVVAGEPLARLIDVDAKLALEQAEADLALREAELASAEAELYAARLRWENPVHLEAALAEAESLLAKTQTESARIPFLIEAAEAREQYARENLAGKKGAAASIAGRLIQQAQSEYDAAAAEVAELEGRKPQLEREVNALRRRTDALAKQRELLIDESRQVADCEAKVKAAEARKRQAQLAADAARLRLERTVVKSPVAGRVLAVVAHPGTRVMGLDPNAEQRASTVVTLYDPAMLQVRADVRLEDVPLVEPGQPVEIETASVKEPMRGHVLHATSQANIQKNTLEVKVAIDAPPETVRPDMLVTATFQAPERPGGQPDGTEQQRLLVPRQLVESEGDAHAVWVADPSGVARRRAIRLGRAGTDELIEAVEGLTPTDRLISGGREGLTDGERITITGEDAGIGV